MNSTGRIAIFNGAENDSTMRLKQMWANRQYSNKIFEIGGNSYA
jgi:hypothetical protein